MKLRNSLKVIDVNEPTAEEAVEESVVEEGEDDLVIEEETFDCTTFRYWT